MDGLHLCWRGPPGTGKRRGLHERLAAVAAARCVPFTITTKPMSPAEEAPADDDSTGAGAAPPELGQLMMESSLVHIGFDVARMSMQDKQVLKPVFAGLGQGSQVLAGATGRGARIVVLYHAHLLSSESVLLLQSCLEMNEGDVSIWLTTELPVAQRIRDWFVEIPVAGADRITVAAGAPSWPAVFEALFARWAAAPRPTIETVKEVKTFVYDLLMRNLRWVEAAHHLLDAILASPSITAEQRRAAVAALAACDATAGGYTIPSYRIPVLWESLFLTLRNIIQPVKQGDAPTRAKRTGRAGRRAAPAAGSDVA